MGHLTLQAEAYQGKLPSCQVWQPQALQQQNKMILVCVMDDDFNLSDVTLQAQAHQGKLPFCQVQWRYSCFILSCDLQRPRDQRALWLYRLMRIEVSCHPAKFDGHRNCDRGDIKILVCHVILQGHVIKSLYNLMDRSP